MQLIGLAFALALEPTPPKAGKQQVLLEQRTVRDDA
jgi:hypothetical protein